MIDNEALKVVSDVAYFVSHGLAMLEDWELGTSEKKKLIELLDAIRDAATGFYAYADELNDALDDAASKDR